MISEEMIFGNIISAQRPRLPTSKVSPRLQAKNKLLERNYIQRNDFLKNDFCQYNFYRENDFSRQLTYLNKNPNPLINQLN